GATVGSGSASGAISLAVGTNTVSVVVTAQDGATTTTYTVTVTRAGSSVSSLSALSLSSGTLSPSFASGTTAYTASVANAVGSVTVTPTASDANATIKVNGTAVTSGSASGAISLAVGTNTVSVVVTAQDGATTTTYTVTVTRTAAGPVVSGVAPSTGAASGGTSVAITGSGFTGATAVRFGSTPATTFTVASATRIDATAPAGTGTVDITVTTPVGTSATAAADRFTWVAGPSIGSIAAQTMNLGTTVSFDMMIGGGVGTLSCTVRSSSSVIDAAGVSFGSCVAGTNRVTVTAAAAGSTVLTLSVVDAAGQRAAVDVAVTVRSTLAARTAVAAKTLRVGTAAGSFVPVVGSGGVGTLTYSVSPGLPAGLALAAATGAISGTPTATSAATGYEVTVTDAARSQARASFSLTVLTAISAEDDTAETKEGLPVTIDVTANDAGGPFTAVAVAGAPSHGTATVSGLAVTYVPTVGFTGVDSFTYRAVKGSDRSSEATVRVTVAARARPDLDASVSGLISAQNQAARQLADTQLHNFQQRLESLHGDNPAGDSFGISIADTPTDDRTVLGYDRTDPEIDRNRGIDPEGRGLAAIGRMTDGSGVRGDRLSAERRRTPVRDDGRVDRAFSFWTAGALTIGNVSSNQRTTGNTFSTSGVTAGVDYRFDPRLTVGVGVGYGRIATDIGTEGSRTVADQYAAAIYASYRPTRTMFVDGVAGFGRIDYTSARALAGSSAMATGRRGGQEFFGSLTAGEEYRGTLEGARWLLSPYARLDVISGRLAEFAETSPVTGTALRYGAQSFGDVSVDLGIRGKIDIRTDFGSISPHFRAELQHDLQTSANATVSWADLIGGTTYTVPVTGLDQNRIMLGAGLDLDWYGYLLGLEYRNTFGSSSETQSVGLKIKKRF
ncbi:autotransporter family protein, partial [Pinisolibacter sp.]|uniref:autotransporter family protein n=1 Tax=Pinisolibacter sp. TaxID=2172024 RepID=UPI002FDD4456